MPVPFARRALFALLLVPFGTPATAQGHFPEKPIRLVVPSGAGGSLDIGARKLAPSLSAALGQPVVVENVPGAGNLVGTGDVARARPDGYTLLMGAGSGLVISPATVVRPTYRGVEDFVPIALVGLQDLTVVAGPGMPARTLKELVDLLKANPGKYGYATTGVGSVNHLGGELFQKVTGTKIVHVPYKGAAPALNDIVAGHVPFGIMATGSVIALYRSGQIRVLASLSEDRLKSFPDVPTVAEAGFPGILMNTFIGLFAPAATPKPIVDRLYQAARGIVADPQFEKEVEALGMAATPPRTPEETQRWLLDYAARVRPIVASAGIKSQ